MKVSGPGGVNAFNFLNAKLVFFSSPLDHGTCFPHLHDRYFSQVCHGIKGLVIFFIGQGFSFTFVCHKDIDIIPDEGFKEFTIFTDYVKEATRLANEGLATAIAEGRNVIWDQTNMSRKKRAAILTKFPDDYTRTCICIEPPETAEDEYELNRRLKSRPGKNIPPFVMANMRKSYQKPNLNEGFATVAFYDISGHTDGTLVAPVSI